MVPIIKELSINESGKVSFMSFIIFMHKTIIFGGDLSGKQHCNIGRYVYTLISLYLLLGILVDGI